MPIIFGLLFATARTLGVVPIHPLYAVFVGVRIDGLRLLRVLHDECPLRAPYRRTVREAVPGAVRWRAYGRPPADRESRPRAGDLRWPVVVICPQRDRHAAVRVRGVLPAGGPDQRPPRDHRLPAGHIRGGAGDDRGYADPDHGRCERGNPVHDHGRRADPVDHDHQPLLSGPRTLSNHQSAPFRALPGGMRSTRRDGMGAVCSRPVDDVRTAVGVADAAPPDRARHSVEMGARRCVLPRS